MDILSLSVSMTSSIYVYYMLPVNTTSGDVEGKLDGSDAAVEKLDDRKTDDVHGVAVARLAETIPRGEMDKRSTVNQTINKRELASLICVDG